MSTIAKYKEALQKQKGKQETLQAQLQKAQDAQASLLLRRDAIEWTQQLIQRTAVETQQLLVLRIEDIVQKTMDAVFPDIYKFSLQFTVSRGRSEARLVFTKDGEEVDPMTSTGGGLVDVVSMALRLACWAMSDTCNTLLFDEAMRFVSRDLAPRASEVLSELAKSLGIQIVFVTHSDAIESVADKAFVVKIKNGVSEVIG
jgi:DNA repair exonuclease SbcCD ATPase subunit